MSSVIVIKRLFFQLFVVVVTISGITSTYAQKVEIGAGVGVMNYTGDISERFRVRFSRPAAEGFFRYNLKSGFTLRAGISGGQITASDKFGPSAFEQQRNLSFKTTLVGADLRTEYNFLDFLERRDVKNWTPYVFGGVGYTFFKPSPKTAEYKQFGVVVPFGVGVKYQIKRPWNIGAEFGARKTFTDHLDNFGNDPTTAGKFQNGNPSVKDMYYYMGVSVSYTFYKIVCP